MERKPAGRLVVQAEGLAKADRWPLHPNDCRLYMMFDGVRALQDQLLEARKGLPALEGQTPHDLAFDYGMDAETARSNGLLTAEAARRRRLRVNGVLEFLTALEMECAEIRDWLPWKHWKTYPPSDSESVVLERDEILNELADVLHFFLNICLLMGVDAPMLYALFVKKNEVNRRRIEEGY